MTVFYLFLLCLPLKFWTNIQIIFTNEYLWLHDINPVVLEFYGIKYFYKVLKEFNFHYLLIISPWREAKPLIKTNVNSQYQRMLDARLVKLAQWFWKTIFVNTVILSKYFPFLVLSPLGHAGKLYSKLKNVNHLKKIEMKSS